MNDLTTTVDTYLAAWNETDQDQREVLIEKAWAADGRLIDPPLAAAGHTGIDEMAATMQEHFPGITMITNAVAASANTRCRSTIPRCYAPHPAVLLVFYWCRHQ